MAYRGDQFTIYDVMEKQGFFASNPANQLARDKTTGESLYKGPVKYPRMLYHPLGEKRVTVPAEVVMTPYGPEKRGEQFEIIHAVVNNAQEEKELLREGWHDHPARAMAAGGEEPPPTGAAEVISNLEEQIRKLEEEKKQALAAAPIEKAQSGVTRPLQKG